MEDNEIAAVATIHAPNEITTVIVRQTTTVLVHRSCAESWAEIEEETKAGSHTKENRAVACECAFRAIVSYLHNEHDVSGERLRRLLEQTLR